VIPDRDIWRAALLMVQHTLRFDEPVLPHRFRAERLAGLFFLCSEGLRAFGDCSADF